MIVDNSNVLGAFMRTLGKLLLGVIIIWLGMVGALCVGELAGINNTLRVILTLTVFLAEISLFFFLTRAYWRNTSLDIGTATRSFIRGIIRFSGFFCLFTVIWLLVRYAQSDDLKDFQTYLHEVSMTMSASKILSVLVGVVIEEVFARYYLIGAMLSEKVNLYVAVFISSLLFSVMHINYNVNVMAVIILVGIVFAQLFILFRSLAPPIALHAMHNLSLRVHNDAASAHATFWEAIQGFMPVMICLVVLTVIWIIKKPKVEDVLKIYTK